ncbi:hypothetical protein IMG5_065960 [Ichthyophthirius multifiliis]|uniref:AP-1 complex subunit gamma n=1 Tax=Ichthyophthirius multifiliis TaxID=5932 RepID=G0QPA3_ICHMU|nr:hypothetical protein IMG5_065960 [Ichthyophthirius multifiliis]EGR32940.1 hypothetical protein IMG5_065960 [Ichthyophthirius multifiliis]|eukprot:XP_004036926.1 hypothetical protein IMG5_065960 [Ichthyophthirius multifiliis]
MSILKEETKEHPLHEFKQIITAYRECKTQAQERELINKEKAEIRERFLQNKEETRAKDVAKLLYISMLGHDTEFGQMECLKLITSSNYGNKRIGYLGLCQLFHENSEVLMLATNRIHLDLNHSNNYVVSLALVALSEICTADMCRELFPDVTKLFGKTSTYIKKKTALCCAKIIKKIPEVNYDLIEYIDKQMEDKHHGVLLSTVSLMKTLVLLNEENKNHFYKHIDTLKKILKSLISIMSTEFEIDGVNDPFLQNEILSFFCIMAKNKPKIAEEISGTLGEVATNISYEKNSGSSVLYECVKTVFEIQSTNSLKYYALMSLFMPELVFKTCAIIDKYAPNRRWQVDTIIKVLSLAGSFAKEDTVNNLINLISVSKPLQQYSVQKLYFALQEKTEQTGLATAALYCIGEYASLCLSTDINEQTIFQLVSKVFQIHDLNDIVKEYGLHCLMKLYNKFNSITANQVIEIFKNFTSSTNPEIQKRSCEYLYVIENQNKKDISDVFSQNPDYEKAKKQYKLQIDEEVGSGEETNVSATNNEDKNTNINLLDDLLNINPQQANNNPTDLLVDLIGGIDETPIAQQDKNNNFDILNLYDNPKQNQQKVNQQQQEQPRTKSQSQVQQTSQTQIQHIDLLDEVQIGQPAQNKKYEMTALEDACIKLCLKCEKTNENTTQIKAEFGNKTNELITNLILQVAVQKHNKLNMNPLTSTQIKPNNFTDTNQLMIIINSMQGQKNIMIKIKIQYTIDNKTQTLEGIAQDFPPDW